VSSLRKLNNNTLSSKYMVHKVGTASENQDKDIRQISEQCPYTKNTVRGHAVDLVHCIASPCAPWIMGCLS
jgi:hypothetical protein